MHSCQGKATVTQRTYRNKHMKTAAHLELHTHKPLAPENITPKLPFRAKKAMHICI